MAIKKSLGTHPFTVEARVAIQLGRESISSSLIAIGELIKNSYDADAAEVVISFRNLGTENPTIVITDDGDGMNKDVLLSKWMRIGTTYKLERRTSNKSRIYTGAKGLGRLGLDRLCTRLSLFTKTEFDACVYEVDVQWEKYDQLQNADLDSVKHEVFELETHALPEQGFPLPNTNKGSQYVLSGLKDTWDEEFLSELRKELSLLVSPFTSNLGFKIKLETSGFFSHLDGFVTSEHFLEAAEWHLKAALSKENEVSIQIFDQSGRLNFKNQPANWSEWMQGWGLAPHCGPVEFDLYFMKNTSSGTVDTNKFKSKDIKAFLRNHQGIRIYRDHFRVKPYGDPNGEGDWLGLAMRRVINPESIRMDNWRIGYNQVVGAVFLGREKNPNLIDQTNREGLTETIAFFELRAFSLKCVELFEKHIQTKARQERVDSPIENNIVRNLDESFAGYQSALHELSELKTNLADQATKSKIASIEATLNAATEQTTSIKNRLDELEAEKDTLANLASLGILFVSFGHETLGAVSNAMSNSNLLKSKIHEVIMLPLDTEEYVEKRFEQIDKSLNYIMTFGNFSLGNVRRDKRTRRVIDIAKVANSVISSFTEILAKRKIKCELSQSSGPLNIRAYEIDWESIFANLITNSCWALMDTPAEERRIQIRLYAESQFCFIDFEDSGRGIEAGVEDHIFKATFTTRRNKKGDSIGTGMGLSIVKTFVEAHSGGVIQLAPKGELGGARFLIKVPSV